MRQEIKKESRMVPHHLLDVNKDLVLQDDEMDKTLSSNNRCWKYSTTFGAVVCFLVLTLYVLLSSNDASSIIGSRRKLVAEQKSTKTTASTTIFYAIGDAPYDNAEAAKLKDQMMNLPKDAEFVVHVGDFTTNNDCPINEYKRAVSSLKVSPVPVFVIRTFVVVFFVIIKSVGLFSFVSCYYSIFFMKRSKEYLHECEFHLLSCFLFVYFLSHIFHLIFLSCFLCQTF